MAKRYLFLLAAGLLAGTGIVSAATVVRAPSIRATPPVGGVSPSRLVPSQLTLGFTDQAILDSIGPEGDEQVGRGILGTPGKNIWVCADWDTVLVVYGPPSGIPDNIFHLWAAYSYDRGHNWEHASSTIGPGAARRIFPGIISPSKFLLPYVAHQHALFSGASYLSSDIYFSYDESFPSMLYTPIRVGPDNPDYHAWLPSIVTTPNGDTVLVSWGNWVTELATGNCYLKRSFDGGVSWVEPEILMVNTQGTVDYDLADSPRMQMGEGGYVFALFNWQPTGTDGWVPFYTESMDYGATWSQPRTVWPSWPPYPGAQCWWYGYDVVLDPADNYRPHCAIKLGAPTFEFGDIWECHPTGGSPGFWTDWVCTCVVGNSNGDLIATQPSIGMDNSSNIFITFSGWLLHAPGDTSPDIGLCYSTDLGATWLDTVITHDEIYETAIELASLVTDSLHIIYVNERDNCQSVWHVLYPNPVYDGSPEMLGAEASDGEVHLPGVDDDDYVTITFSESTTRPTINSANIDSVLALSNGHTWLDGSGQIEGALWNTVGDSLQILLSVQSGVPTIAPGDTITPDGVTITDPEGNPCVNQVMLTSAFYDSIGPVLVEAEASDGSVPGNGIDEDDWVTIAFDEPTNRAAIDASNIDSVLTLSSGHTWLDGNSQIDSAVWNAVGDSFTVLLSITGGPPTVAVGDTITADGVTITDENGNPCATSVAITGTFDDLGPVMIEAEASDGTIPGNGIDEDDYVAIGFDEATNKPIINSSNVDNVLALSSGHTWLDGNNQIDSAVWNTVGDSLIIFLSITGGPPTVAVGDTITPDGVTIRDIWGNPCTASALITGSFDPVGLEEEEHKTACSPKIFALSQNCPNPAKSGTEIRYQLPTATKVRLCIYSIAGRLVETLVDSQQRPGHYAVEWDGKQASSGIYFYRLQAGDFSSTKKMVVFK